jgi:protein involved in polysaccharide export with SLBB domain
MKINKIFSLWVLIFVIGLNTPVLSQVNSQNLGSVKVDELSDDQVRSFLRQAQASGMGDAQLEQMAQSRGMPPEEVKKLRERADKLKNEDKKQSGQSDSNKNQSITDGRKLNYELENSSKNEKNPENEAEKALLELRSKIFGADLFKNSNMTFEPNMNMATPKNYVIGPNDEILIDLFGNSEVSYNLKVSPEGTINVQYVGIIPVSGLTIEAATSRIRSKMTTIYGGLKSGATSINIAIGNIRSIKVILTGEVVKPGTYTLPSLANVFNALYSSGGPTENGSFRAVELIRGGKKISTIDIYDFLLRGEIANNLRLQDQDLIRVPVYKSRIELVGEVKRPGIFELLPEESFNDLLIFAGDFTENAYKARVKVLKNTDTERKIADVSLNQFREFKPSSGDKYFVERVLERFTNRVTIEGAVFRPGQYELESGLSLSQLIKKSEGLKEDAFMQRGYITRLLPDNQTQLLSFDLGGILNGKIQDIQLFREDVISISSIFDLKDEYKVRIDGEIRQPGFFDYAQNMTLETLIQQAGGLTEGASSKRIEISRRTKNSNFTSPSSITAQVFQVDIEKDLNFSNPKFELQPFDIVSVRSSIGYEVQRQVKVEGEVLFPGIYTIINKDEKISDLLKRAGGLTDLAYARGASLKREGLPSVKGKNSIETSEDLRNKIEKINRLQDESTDSLNISEKDILKNSYVGISLEKIILEPGSISDLILEEGDILRVPKKLQTVKVNGEVLFPVTTIYNNNREFKYYISQGGGFSSRALKRKSYVLYANGSVKSTRKILLLNDYPQLSPGAEIFIPRKADKRPTSASEIVGISSAMASLAVIILSLVK